MAKEHPHPTSHVFQEVIKGQSDHKNEAISHTAEKCTHSLEYKKGERRHKDMTTAANTLQDKHLQPKEEEDGVLLNKRSSSH